MNARPDIDAFPLDFRNLVRPGRPVDYLMLPPHFESAANQDAESPVFDATPDALRQAWLELMAATPRTTQLNGGPEGLQLQFVQRSAVFRFPDFIWVEFLPVADGSALAAYSRARFGVTDFGVNRKRIEGWVKRLAARIQAGS